MHNYFRQKSRHEVSDDAPTLHRFADDKFSVADDDLERRRTERRFGGRVLRRQVGTRLGGRSMAMGNYSGEHNQCDGDNTEAHRSAACHHRSLKIEHTIYETCYNSKAVSCHLQASLRARNMRRHWLSLKSGHGRDQLTVRKTVSIVRVWAVRFRNMVNSNCNWLGLDAGLDFMPDQRNKVNYQKKATYRKQQKLNRQQIRAAAKKTGQDCRIGTARTMSVDIADIQQKLCIVQYRYGSLSEN